MSKKMTNKQMFEQILAKLTDAAEVEFIQHQIDMLNKRAENKTSKPTEKQIEGKKMRDAIVAFLADFGDGMTISEMLVTIPACANKSNQCVTQHLTQLVKADEVIRYEVKGKAYFKVA